MYSLHTIHVLQLYRNYITEDNDMLEYYTQFYYTLI